MELILRPFAGSADYRACLEIQNTVWGFEDPHECIPPVMMKISAQVGAVGIGAFEESGRMVGFNWGLSGVRRGGLVHWSHMLAVLPEVRDHGLGQRLKLRQREEVLRLGIDRVHWTFDSLEAKNAHLNFNRLGAVAQEYERDFYGSGDASHLHRGQGTDRLIVTWQLRSDRVESALERRLPGDLERFARLPIANEVAEPHLPARVEVPADIQALKSREPEAGMRWRQATRRCFEPLFAQGGIARDFYRDPASGRCFYIMAREGIER